MTSITLTSPTNAAADAVPSTEAVAELANAFHGAILGHPVFDRLRYSTYMYVDCWATFTGYPIIARWDQDGDVPGLFEEALRVLAMKAAVFRLSGGDEKLAELLVSNPVDEMVHAVIAQATLCSEIAADTGMPFVHMTDKEEFGYNAGDWTWQLYVAAWGSEPPERYWIDADVVKARLRHLGGLYGSVGIKSLGRRHDITFEGVEAQAALSA